MQNSYLNRTPLQITLSTWKALFLREALSRLTGSRIAWLWLLFEPIFHMSFLLFIFTVMRMRTVGGINIVVWLLVGLIFFFTFKRTATQTKNGITPNKQLFTYRQVKPIDTVISRAFLEAFLMTIIGFIVVAAASLFGVDFMPNDFLSLILAFFGIWLFGLGFGLITSVCIQLAPDSDHIINLLMTPAYMLSGVIIPISNVPEPYRHYLSYNPIVHGIETARQAMSTYYHTIPELDLNYLYSADLVTIFIGLALHRRFEYLIGK